MKRLLPFLLLLAAAAPARAQKAAVPELRFQRLQLDNGLEVILLEDDQLPLVAVNVWYHVGAANERAGRSGFAHLFEHMMFKGSVHVRDGQHFGILEGIGARGVNATTNFDRTNYFETAPANQLEKLLWLESDRMGFLADAIDEKKLTNQKDVVRNERRQRTENRPYGMADEALYQLLFPQPHPYHGVIIGSHEDLVAATVADVRDFFRTYYSPGNATLVIAGAISPTIATDLVEKYFAPLPAGPARPPVTATLQPPPDKEIRKAMSDHVQLARVSFGWVTVPAFGEGEAELQLAADLLGGGKTSLLYKKLVYGRRIAQEGHCEVESMTLGSVVSCDITAKPGVQLAELEKAFDAELAALREKGPSAADLERAQIQRRSRFLHGLERLGSRADLLNRYSHFKGDPGYLRKDLARFAAVTPASLRGAAQKWLDPNHRVVISVQPEAK